MIVAIHKGVEIEMTLRQLPDGQWTGDFVIDPRAVGKYSCLKASRSLRENLQRRLGLTRLAHISTGLADLAQTDPQPESLSRLTRRFDIGKFSCKSDQWVARLEDVKALSHALL